jgi:uncharacterized damage-inducible protein DinB
MFLDAIVRLYDYQREVNNHVLKVAEQLSTEELTAVIVEGQPSIRDTLLHSFDVIQINAAWWSRRLSGEEAFALEFPSEIYTNISELRVLWESGDSEVTSFIDSLDSDADLGRIYKRKTPEGEMRTRVLWEMMLHVINHGTQHRSEVALMLTKLGHSPGDMEIL